jgi:protein-disulfide isomerase
VIAGLVLGKALGVWVATAAAVRLRVGPLPAGFERRHLPGASALAGIGFTVSLFIAELAFDDERLRDEAKVGVLVASVLAAAVGWGLLRRARTRSPAADAAQPPRLRPPVDARLDHIRGRRDAPLALVEYGDYACPHTSAAAAAVERARARHGERLRYVFRHLPLEDAHPHAPLAAEAAQAAGAQGRFWELHDRLMAADGDLDPGELVDHARALGLDLERFGEDLRHHVHAPAVQADLDSARRSGARGTPTFYVEGGARSPAAGPLTLEQALAALDDATRGAGSRSTS